MIYSTLTPDLPFPKAFELWMSHRLIDAGAVHTDASYLSLKTIKDYRACFRALSRFFGKLRLDQIHAGHLREYQNCRAICDRTAAAWCRPAGANRIRKEIALLIRVLRAGGVWREEQELAFQPLRPVENDLPRAMQVEEQNRFLITAASRAEWQLIHWYTIVGLQTTASTNELRALRIADLLFTQGIIQIRREGAKNKYRMRAIPIETRALEWALESLVRRARGMGAVAPHHYLFPIQEARGIYDPNRPMSDSGLKKRWNAVREAAGLPWLRPYDLRHTGATRMAEAGVPVQIIMSYMGHATPRQQQHYTAIGMASMRQWAGMVWGEPGELSRKGPLPERYTRSTGFLRTA